MTLPGLSKPAKREVDELGAVRRPRRGVGGVDRQHGDGRVGDEALDRLGHVAGGEHRQMAIVETHQAGALRRSARDVDDPDEDDLAGGDLVDRVDDLVGERRVVVIRQQLRRPLRCHHSVARRRICVS